MDSHIVTKLNGARKVKFGGHGETAALDEGTTLSQR